MNKIKLILAIIAVSCIGWAAVSIANADPTYNETPRYVHECTRYNQRSDTQVQLLDCKLRVRISEIEQSLKRLVELHKKLLTTEHLESFQDDLDNRTKVLRDENMRQDERIKELEVALKDLQKK